MKAVFNSSSWVLTSLFIVVPSLLICLWILWIIRRHFALRELKKSHDVVGFTFSIVGVLYLAFMLYLVYTLDNAFNGPLGLKPNALEQVSNLFKQWSAEN